MQYSIECKAIRIALVATHSYEGYEVLSGIMLQNAKIYSLHTLQLAPNSLTPYR